MDEAVVGVGGVVEVLEGGDYIVLLAIFCQTILQKGG